MKKSDVFVKLLLVFFVSLLSFAVGTYVGKEYSDHQHKLSQLEPSNSRQATKTEDHETNDEHSERAPATAAAMSDKEIASLAEEFLEDEKAQSTSEDHKSVAEDHKSPTVDHKSTAEGHSQAHGEAPGDTHAENRHDAIKTTDEHAPEKPSQIASALAKADLKKQDPLAVKASPEKQERRPSSLPTKTLGSMLGKFTIQLLSTQDEQEAHIKVRTLQKKGYSAFYIPASVRGKTWYRVNIGQFNSPKEAVDYKEQLIKNAVIDTAFVQKISE